MFIKPENLGDILRQNAHYGILAVAMTFVIITAGIAAGAALGSDIDLGTSRVPWPGP